MAQRVKADRRRDLGPRARKGHAPDLVRLEPCAAVRAGENASRAFAACREPVEEGGAFLGQNDMPSLAALALADREGASVGIVVMNLNPAELAVPRARL